MADPNERTFSTREAEANRARRQGPGSGQSEADARRDPNRVQTATHRQPRSFEGDLGAGTPANVDIHKLGQDDKPEQAWGESAGPDATFSSNHTRRGEKTEAERGQGAKTRTANKDLVSRR